MCDEFSVCMSVYKNDTPKFVKEALDSVTIKQTLPPTEVVLVVDGPIPDELNELLKSYEATTSLWAFNIIRLSENKGLGNALRIAVENATYDVIARMDSDDIALPDRFEKQLKCFQEDKELSIMGSAITEFIDSPSNVVGKRICPTENNDLKKYMKSRCGFNHVTVMFRKSEVLKVGNYQDWHYNEDYYLWIRMMLAGCKFANLPDTLVNVRVGKEMYARRGGWKYFKSEEGIQRYMWNNKLISFPRYLLNTCIRFGVQVVIPNNVRGWLFRKLFRKN